MYTAYTLDVCSRALETVVKLDWTIGFELKWSHPNHSGLHSLRLLSITFLIKTRNAVKKNNYDSPSWSISFPEHTAPSRFPCYRSISSVWHMAPQRTSSQSSRARSPLEAEEQRWVFWLKPDLKKPASTSGRPCVLSAPCAPRSEGGERPYPSGHSP